VRRGLRRADPPLPDAPGRLALLATVFAVIQTEERGVSRNYVDGVRARLIAQSGIEEGTQRLEEALSRSILELMAECSKNPSFAWEEDENPLAGKSTLQHITVHGEELDFTGCTTVGRYGLHSDFFTLRITDLQGRIYVNDGLREAGVQDTDGDGFINANDSTVSQNLRRILNNLGAIPSVGVPGLGNKILGKRPSGGFRVLLELEPILGSDDFRKVREFLTTKAWIDPNVANPVPLSGAVLGSYPVKYYRGDGVYRYGRNRDAFGNLITTDLLFRPPGPHNNGTTVFGMDELNPQWIQIVERAPVNVNTAAREVLIALLDGLRGFFLLERRNDEFPGFESAYRWIDRTYSLQPRNDDQAWTGAVGYLYQTVPIVGPGSGILDGVSASAIAEHLLACREKRATSGETPPFDYSGVSWAGPFLTWRQFNTFVDNLLAIGLFQDNRDYYYEWLSGNAGGRVPSPIQRQRACRAIADVLKANFNPNLHLNETNPDANLFTSVDKTDLVVNSTEFCFLPMGYFEIESTGRVVRPRDTGDAFTASDNELIAESRMSVVVKLYDAYRETSQKQFSRGAIAPRKQYPVTNNNLSLEIGPEPDQGTAPYENDWGGYIALPTVGGNGLDHPKGSTRATPAGPMEKGEALRVHFSGDFAASFHLNGMRTELASAVLPDEGVSNFADRTETVPGPYSPLTGHRIARSFRVSPGLAVPPLTYQAPSDLRIDGGFSERHSAPAYWLSQGMLGGSTGEMNGAISMWVKPSFFPEMSGKGRLWLDLSRFHAGETWYMNPSPFMLLYTATQDAPAYQLSPAESAIPFYNLGAPSGVQGIRPMSLGWGYGYSQMSGHWGAAAEGGVLTPTLNHLSHPDAWKPSYLKGHEWVHLVVTWSTPDPNSCRIYVNGQILPGTTPVWYSDYRPSSWIDWSRHADDSRNSLRLGAVSRYRAENSGERNRDWAADATIDEVYVWSQVASAGVALGQWFDGRYYKVTGADGYFTSGSIDLAVETRKIPPASLTASPSGGMGASPQPLPVTSPSVRLIGVSWTWFGETMTPDGKEVLIEGNGAGYLEVATQVSLLTDGSIYGPYSSAGFSPIAGPGGTEVQLSKPFQYRIQFPSMPTDAVLLATPVFDDITIFYRCGIPTYESWVQS